MPLTFKKLAPSEDDIVLAEKLGVRYKKYQKNDFKKMRLIVPPNEESINNLEKLFGKIPLDYLKFLEKYNGGIPTPNLAVLPNGDTVVVGGLLLSAGEVNVYNSIENYANIYKNMIPRNNMPIGFSPSGDLFLIETNTRDSEAVLYWKHDLESNEADQFGLKNLFVLSNSFSEFISKLTQESE